MRTKKAILNTITSLLYQFVTIVSGLILPKLILSNFGSSYNGITSSITQFLACANLFVAGVGGVTKAALYKPLAEGDWENTSAIINATNRFMKKIALILCICIFILACVYPFFVKEEFDWIFSFSLVLIFGINTFLQYFFGVTYQLLLKSDQKQYIISLVQVLTTVINTVLAVILLKSGFGIHIIKLGAAFAFSLNPLIITLYVRKKYDLNKKAVPNNFALKQRWDAFWQAVANFVHNNTDVIILTLFTDLKEVSVYTVYNYVIANIKNLIRNVVYGFSAAFGNMLAKKEYELLHKNLKAYELIIFSLTAIVYSTAGTMIVPFVLIYTNGVSDVSYSRPLFALIVTIAGAFNCFRLPYQTIVEAAGHFKQTRNGALFEASINICVSLIMVIKFGLIGVAIGTLVATIFRSVQYAIYLSNNILKRSIFIFLGHITVNIFIAIIVYLISQYVLIGNLTNWWEWIASATMVTCVSTIVTLMMDFVFYRNDLFYLYKKFKRNK